jgi:flagellar export protein FliJ
VRRFHFRLETVRRWREVRLEAERAALEALYQELRGIEARTSGLDRKRRDGESAVKASSSAEAQQLLALDAFARHVIAEKARLDELARRCEARIAARRESVRKAERDLRLLEKMKERRSAEWVREFGRELEALASEVYLATRRGGR